MAKIERLSLLDVMKCSRIKFFDGGQMTQDLAQSCSQCTSVRAMVVFLFEYGHAHLI